MRVKILLVGGGTGGSVTPLLAVASELRHRAPPADVLFVGSARGPERTLCDAAHIPFVSITAGKWRRYFSMQNISDLFRLCVGFFQSWKILDQFRPDCVFSAGSYLAVPMIWCAWMKGVPSIIHQQDFSAGLANRLCAPFATAISVTLEKSLADFPKRKTQWLGNPVRSELLNGDPRRARERFELRSDLPVILAFGGGTGALHLNQLIVATGLNLVHDFQILHLTGGRQDAFTLNHPNYHAYEFVTEGMADAYAVADIVVCRAGLSTLTELSALSKAAIVVPIAGTHQVANAEYFRKNDAVVVLDEKTLTRDSLEQSIRALSDDPSRREQLQKNIRRLCRMDATASIAAHIDELARKKPLMRLQKKLLTIVNDCRAHERLGNHTNFRIGGPADLFAVCKSRDELSKALSLLRREGVTFYVLGGGTNILFPDQGIRGVVLQVRNTEWRVIGNEVVVGAGMNIGLTVYQCLKAGLTGLEFAVGIYGTIGGAIRGNAGSFGHEMKDFVVSCDVVTADGTAKTLTNEQMRFNYRDSLIKHEPMTIISARLKLHRGNVAEARQSIARNIEYKRSHQPLSFPSAGCIFKNYILKSGDEQLRKEFSEVLQRGNVIPAWTFIERVGLAGKRVGGIQISDQHANFFLNVGEGTAEQVVMLASLVKQRVRDQYAVQLEEEVQFIGF